MSEMGIDPGAPSGPPINKETKSTAPDSKADPRSPEVARLLNETRQQGERSTQDRRTPAVKKLLDKMKGAPRGVDAKPVEALSKKEFITSEAIDELDSTVQRQAAPSPTDGLSRGNKAIEQFAALNARMKAAVEQSSSGAADKPPESTTTAANAKTEQPVPPTEPQSAEEKEEATTQKILGRMTGPSPTTEPLKPLSNTEKEEVATQKILQRITGPEIATSATKTPETPQVTTEQQATLDREAASARLQELTTPLNLTVHEVDKSKQPWEVKVTRSGESKALTFEQLNALLVKESPQARDQIVAAANLLKGSMQTEYEIAAGRKTTKSTERATTKPEASKQAERAVMHAPDVILDSMMDSSRSRTLVEVKKAVQKKPSLLRSVKGFLQHYFLGIVEPIGEKAKVKAKAAQEKPSKNLLTRWAAAGFEKLTSFSKSGIEKKRSALEKATSKENSLDQKLALLQAEKTAATQEREQLAKDLAMFEQAERQSKLDKEEQEVQTELSKTEQRTAELRAKLDVIGKERSALGTIESASPATPQITTTPENPDVLDKAA